MTLKWVVLALLASSLVSACGDTETLSLDEAASPHRDGEQAFPGRVGKVESLWIETPTGLAEVKYELIDGYAIIDGDIVLFGPEDAPKGAARSLPAFRWPDGVVPFVIDEMLVNTNVFDAIAHWEANTPIRFVERTSQEDFVVFRPGAGCSSPVGRWGGRQFITLAQECSRGNAIHEIGHAVGLWHEHTRADRDGHVVIHWENIEEGREHNFRSYVERGMDGMDVGPYDFGSIMHYGSFAFSRNGNATITRHDGSTFAAQRDALSDDDISSIQRIYPGSVEGPNELPLFTTADYNGDGRDDWSWWAPWTNDLIALISRGDGNWTEWHHSTAGWGDLSDLPLFTTADYNGDGNADVSWWAPWTNDFIVLLSHGNGNWTEWHYSTAGWFL